MSKATAEPVERISFKNASLNRVFEATEYVQQIPIFGGLHGGAYYNHQMNLTDLSSLSDPPEVLEVDADVYNLENGEYGLGYYLAA